MPFTPFSQNRKSSASSRKALRAKSVEGTKQDIAMDKKMGLKEGSMADTRQDNLLSKRLGKRSSLKQAPKR